MNEEKDYCDCFLEEYLILLFKEIAVLMSSDTTERIIKKITSSYYIICLSFFIYKFNKDVLY